MITYSELGLDDVVKVLYTTEVVNGTSEPTERCIGTKAGVEAVLKSWFMPMHILYAEGE